MRNRRRYFASAGEKRKFCNNIRHFGRTRDISIAMLGLLPGLGIVALFVFACLAMFLVMNSGSAAGVVRATVHGKHQLISMGALAFGTVALAREKRAERGVIADKMKVLSAKSATWTAEDRTNFDNMINDEQALKADIDRLEAAATLDAEMRGVPNPPNPSVGAKVDKKACIQQYRSILRRCGSRPIPLHATVPEILMNARSYALGKMSEQTRTVAEEYHERFNEALKEYFLVGENMKPETRAILNGTHEEFRDMGVATGAAGGFFVPQGFVYEVEEAMKYYGPMLQVAEILDTATGNALPYPTDNDTSQSGEQVGEAQQVSTADISIGQITFNAFAYSTKMIKVSRQLLQDSAFDLVGFIQRKFAQRIGRILNTKFTVGAGTTTPNGIITAATAGPTAVGSSGNDGGAGTAANSIGSNDLIELEHSIDPVYRNGAAYMAHDSTIKFIKQLKDKQGRPLWLPGLALNAPDTILSYPYWSNNDMDTIATTKKTVAFGQLGKYLVRRVKEMEIMRLNERYADTLQVAFLGFSRYDGNLLDAGTNPVKYLVQG